MKRLLLVTAFTTGSVLMALEMVGSRLLAPYFGNSIYVWGNLIGVILLAMSLGYYFGGRLSEEKPTQLYLFLLVFASSFYILLTLFFYRPLLSWAVSLGVLLGSIISTLALFAVPLLLLSMVPPYAIKLFSLKRKVGHAVGAVNSISTIGNIFGVYFSTFVMIPHLGTRLSLHFCFFTLLIISLLGLTSISKKYLFLALTALLLLLTPAYAVSPDVVYEDESLYNHITLRNDGKKLMLFLGSEEGLQSLYDFTYYFNGKYYSVFLFMPYLTEMDNLLILGMGGGTSVDQFSRYFPEITIDAVEIDGKVIDVAKEYFHITESPTIRIFEDDARPFVMKSQEKYDAIELDVYHHTIYIPFYLVTKEFFAEAHERLSDHGVLGMNVFNPSGKRELVDRIEQTMLTVFPSVFEVSLPGNKVIFAFKDPISLEELHNRLSALPGEEFQSLYRNVAITKVESDASKAIFTDDLAPVEELTRILEV